MFTFFSDSTTSSMTAIINNASLIKKIYVPKYLFVLSRVFSSFINLMALVYSITISYGGDIEQSYIGQSYFVPVPMLLLVGFCLGIGLILSAITVKFKRYYAFIFSICYGINVYLTPVIYPMSILPEWLYPIVRLNPYYKYPVDVS